MKELLNSINNSHLIKIGNSWIFCFTEEDELIPSPVVPHYFIGYDLSINLLLRYKWSLYGWFFLKSLSETLDNEDYEHYKSFADSINPNFEPIKYNKILLVDGTEMGSLDLFKNHFENKYIKMGHNQNDLVGFKLKLNVSEFIIIQNMLFPKMAEIV